MGDYTQNEPKFRNVQWTAADAQNLDAWEGKQLLSTVQFGFPLVFSVNDDGSLHFDRGNGDVWDWPPGTWFISRMFYGPFPGYYSDANPGGVQYAGLFMSDEDYQPRYTAVTP